MTDKTKTLLITTPYFPPYGGGLERYAFEIASRLHRDFNWKVVVITSGERRGKDTKEEINGLTVHRLSYRLKISNTPFSFRWFKKIHNILKEENPDVINIHTPVPGIGDITALISGRTPLIVTYHTGSMRKGKMLSDIFVWLYEHGPMRHFLNRADHIICSSDFVRFDFLKRYTNKSTTITPAIDTSIFKPDPAKRAKDPTILFVAGLGKAEQHKGLQTLIEAVKKIKESVPNVRLNAVGDGDMRGEYERRVKNLSLEETVIFAGRLSGEKLVEKYQQAYVFALPSSNESFSMAILEAMASGLPVVATNVGGIPILVEDNKTGFLFQADSIKELVQKLSELIMNQKCANAFGVAGREKVLSGFDWSARATQYDGICMKLYRENKVVSPLNSRIFSNKLNKNIPLTVVILTYNSEKTIIFCLDSLVEQTNKNFNIIIVDDDSTDDTLQIIDAYKKDSCLKIEVVKNGAHSIPKGRNIGLRSSKSDLVAFLDSDDRAELYWVETIINIFESNPEAGLLSGLLMPVGQNTIGEAIAAIDGTVRRFFGKGVTLFCTANSAFNKRILKNECFFDEDFDFSEDMEVASRIQRHFKLVFVPEMKVYQNSRSTFSGYALQMYRYGLWRVYYIFVTSDYRLVDFIPLTIIILSVFACILFSSWIPFFALVIFSFFESLFVIIMTCRKPSVSLLIFPAWLVKNYAWSLGIAHGLIALIADKRLRAMFKNKRKIMDQGLNCVQ